MRTTRDIEQALGMHGPAVWRACCLYFPSQHDAQDAYQETFLRYATADASFDDEEHRKAWLVRVATNICKDMLKHSSRKAVSFDEGVFGEVATDDDPLVQPHSFHSEAVEAIRALSDPPRTPIYLSLVEGYEATEIARMLEAPVNTVYSWIARGKKQLREALS